MNRNLLYGGAALLGVVGALVPFLLLNEAPSPTTDPAEAPEEGASVSAPVPARSGTADAQAVLGGERKEPRPAGAEGGKPRTEFTEARDRMLNSGFGKHSREAAPAFQLLSLNLREAGAEALADEARVYSQELRQRRTEANVDRDAVLAKERALVQKVRDAGYGDEAAEALTRIEELMASYEADNGTPEPAAPGEAPAAP